MRNVSSATLDRFWSKVDKSGSCWCWTAYRKPTGYGVFKYNGKLHRAHRFALEVTHGEIPEGLVVRHKCDNPSCCNPEHLEIGTQADNMRDRTERGRGYIRPARYTSEMLKGLSFKEAHEKYGISNSRYYELYKR